MICFNKPSRGIWGRLKPTTTILGGGGGVSKRQETDPPSQALHAAGPGVVADNEQST